MKPDVLHKYCIRETNHIRKYSYSREPFVDKDETNYYELDNTVLYLKGITLSKIQEENDKVTGLSLVYYTQDDGFRKATVTLDKPAKITRISGNPENYLVEDMMFELIKKR